MFDSLSDRLAQAFKKIRGHGKLSEDNIQETLREVRLALLEADVNFKVVKEFIAAVKVRAVGEEVLKSVTPGQQVVKIVHDELVRLLGENPARIQLSPKPPTLIMLVGLQGSGKTTSAGKIAKQFAKEGKKPLLVACDIYRPAAVNQLLQIGKQLNVPVFSIHGAKPVVIAREALVEATQHANQVVIVDTAGRLHIDEALMDELRDLKVALKPQEILFVADAMTGQEAVNVAQAFNEALDISGVVLTKMDGDARGGAALSIRALIGKPVKYVGVGEKLDLLEPFNPKGMASRILGMGDVVSLVEKAQQAITQEEALQLQEKLLQDEFTLEDFLDQLHRIKKMGPIGSLLDMLPKGMKPQGLDMPKGEDAEADFKRIEAIIYSMTKTERNNHQLINSSRKKRIANGSGTTVADVNQLLKEFVQAKDMMSQFNPMGLKVMKKKKHKKEKKKKLRGPFQQWGRK